MRASADNLQRLLRTLCACVLLLAPAAAFAESSLSADLDGDGLRDHVTVSRDEPSILRVWLSTTGRTTIIHSRTPVVRVMATDLDGDHRAELITRGPSTALQIWTRKRSGFKSYRPHRVRPLALAPPTHHAIDEDSHDQPSTTQAPGSVMLALTLSAQPRAPALAALCRLSPAAFCPARTLARAPFSPRPPPYAV